MSESPTLSAQNPWPGLRAFTEDDRRFFFGREREALEMLELVRRSPVVVLFGQSGLGKTSLLQAGLFPDLKRLDFLPLRVRLDHGEDAPALAQQIKNALVATLDRLQISGRRPDAGETLWEYCHRNDVDFWGPRNRLLTPVIVLDQFEEVFTLGQRSARSSQRVAQFAADLESVLEHRPPVAVRERLDAHPDEARRFDLQRRTIKFLITLREDFLADLDSWRARMPSLLPNRFRLERMTGAQALEVVERAGGDLIEPAVARDVVDFVSRSQRGHALRDVEQRDVEPALLSVVCDELNRRRMDLGKPRITADLLSQEREEIIQSFYERAFEQIDPRVRDWVEDRLLTASGYRNRAAIEDALKEGLPGAAFDQLVNARVLHREERAGIVWLELTHDLLSDPAARSRTARDQRRQAEEARRQQEETAEREARLRVELGKSRRRATVYGFLLLGTAAALVFGVLSWRGYITSTQLAEASRKTADQAEQSRARSYETAADMTERLALQVGDGNWIPAATVVHNIDDEKRAYRTLSGQATPDQRARLEVSHARRLTKAADSLFQIGHVEDGLREAKAALEILRRLGGGQAPGDVDRLALAQALYEEGTGLLATGQLALATHSFEESLKLITPVPKSDSARDFARVFVLSQLGLGKAGIQQLKLPAAAIRFHAALDFVNTYKSDADEVLSWKALAYQGLGLSEWNDAEAQKYYTTAGEILGASAGASARSLTARDPGNLSWKALVADLTFRQGWSLLGLSQYEEATKYFEISEAVAKDLCSRDCASALGSGSEAATSEEDGDNWRWRLLLLQAWKGLGWARMSLREWDGSDAVLRHADRIAEILNHQQPSWTDAAYLHASVEKNLGNLGYLRYTRFTRPIAIPSLLSFSLGKDPKELFANAEIDFQHSERILAERGYATSEDREFVRLASLVGEGQGSLRAAKADICRQKNADLCIGGLDTRQPSDADMLERAGELDRQALDKYRDAFKRLEPIAAIAKDSAEIISDEAALYSLEGHTFSDLKQDQNAIAAYRNAVAALELLVRREHVSDVYNRLAAAHISLGDVFQAKHESASALPQFASAMDAITQALAHSPKDNRAEYLGTQALIYHRFSDISFAGGDLAASLGNVEKALAAQWEALQGAYADAWLNGNIKIFLTGSGSTSLDTLQQALLSAGSGSAQRRVSPEQRQTLLKRIADLRKHYDLTTLPDLFGQTAGGLQPTQPGEWYVLAGAELRTARDQLLAAAKKVSANRVHGIRRLPLSFYDNAWLYEAGVDMVDGTAGMIEYVRRGTESFILDGSGDQIRHINNTSPPKLDTIERASAYLRFVVGQMQSVDSGRAQLIDRPEDIAWLPDASAKDRAGIADKIRPLILERSYDGEWQGTGSLIWEAGLHVLSFHVSRDGQVSIGQERMDNVLPIRVDVFTDGIRTQTILPVVYAQLNRWPEAVAGEQRLLAALHQEDAKNHTNRTDKLRLGYMRLASYQLYVRDYAGALATTDTLQPLDALRADEMRAPALLLLGRSQEAETIYLRDMDKKFELTDWKTMVFADIKAMEDANITSPEFEHVRGLMNLAQVEARLKADANDETALRLLPAAYSNLKRWKEAVAAQKQWLAFAAQHEPNGDARTRALAGGYSNLSWFQLFARDFAGALASTDAGKKLEQSNLYLEGNRAHALLFLGRTAEAEAIYLANRGKGLNPEDPKETRTWEKAVLTDFADLEAAGLTNPEIPRIRKLLSSTQE